MRPSPLLLVASALLLAAVAASSARSDAPAPALRPVHLVVSGSVAEPGGRPVRGARILLEGLRAPAALSGADGRFAFLRQLPAPGAPAGEPVRVVLRANHRNWRLALASGASALALEIRPGRAADGRPQLEVRANDAQLAADVAAALGAPGEVTVPLRADFVRQVGAEDRSAPALTAQAVVPLPAEPEPPLPAPAPAVVATPAPATVTTPAPAPAVATTPAPSVVATPAPGTVTTPALAADSARVRGARSPAAGPASERQGRPSLFPGPPEARPAPGNRRTRRAAPPADSLEAPADRQAGSAGAGAGPAARRPVPDSAAAGPRRIRVSVRPDTAAALGDTIRSTAGRPAQDVLRVEYGRARTEVSAPAGGEDSCLCRLEGTVEVRSDRPLAGRLRVVVTLAEEPAPRDTVELFMGPPRPFALGRVPCGTRHLVVRALGARRFALVEPAGGAVECRASQSAQSRVVLESR
jgi:hypothetical protein